MRTTMTLFLTILFAAVLVGPTDADELQVSRPDKGRPKLQAWHLVGDAPTETPLSFGITSFDLDGDGVEELLTSRDSAGGSIDLPSLQRWYTTELERGAQPVLPAPRSARGMAAGDFDGDGDLDVYLVVAGGTNILLENRDGVMVDATPALLDDPGVGRSAAWADFDRDGDLDLYLVNAGSPDRLFVNEGNGEWKLHDDEEIALLEGNAYSVNWIDLDRDGRLDLHVVQHADDDVFLRQNEAGSFERVQVEGFPTGNRAMGADWGDVDGDGREDVLLASFSGDHRLLKNLDGVRFVDITPEALSGVGPAWSGRLVDIDLDGRSDISMVPVSGPSVAVTRDPADLWQVMVDAPVAGPSIAQVWSDRDDDGDLDLSVPGTTDPVTVTNELDAGHWLRVRLEGSDANTYGVGAVVEVKAAGLTQSQTIRAGDGYMGRSQLEPTFGLGWPAQLEQVRVRWPNGFEQVVPVDEPDRVITIVQPPVEDMVARAGEQPTRTRLVGNTPNPFNPSTTIHFDLAHSSAVRAVVYDVAGKRIRTLADGSTRSAGAHQLVWNGDDDSGALVASGVYFVRLDADGVREAHRMVLVK